ncbi:MFS transporter [bacterium]|nr:MFS transporter [bacterium]
MVIKTEKPSPLFFYGWVIVALGFLTLAFTFGIWYSFSVFFLAIIEDFGWSRAATSSIFSLFILNHAVMGILAGYLQDRFGPRIVIPVGALILSVSLLITSRSTALWHFYIAYGLAASTGVSFMGFISFSAFLPNWFERKRGLAVGITMAGIGFGMLILVPILERVITLAGWRMAYVYAAGAVLFFIGPVNFVFARQRPSDLNLLPDGDTTASDQPAIKRAREVKIINTEWVSTEWTIPKALGTKRFWFILSAFFFISFAYQSTLLHSVSAMVDGGLSRTTGALIFGILGIAGSGGKIMLGYLSDVFGRERVSTAGGIMASLGIICLLYVASSNLFLSLLFALLFGIGYGSAAPLLPSISADIFSGPSFGVIFALIGIGGGMGGSTGSFISGLIRDMTGSYTLSLLIAICSITISCLMIWLASPRKIRRTLKN